jgi:hypothetical protein
MHLYENRRSREKSCDSLYIFRIKGKMCDFIRIKELIALWPVLMLRGRIWDYHGGVGGGGGLPAAAPIFTILMAV